MMRAHDFGGEAQEVGSVLPFHALPLSETNVRFIDQCRGLERVAHAFASHVAASEPAEFLLDKRDQFVNRGAIAVAPFVEKCSDSLGGGHALFQALLESR
jgi:hypothetical protein